MRERLGGGKVVRIEEPIYGGANGALKIALLVYVAFLAIYAATAGGRRTPSSGGKDSAIADRPKMG